MPRVKHTVWMSVILIGALGALIACQPRQPEQVMVAIQQPTPGVDRAATLVDEDRPLVEALRGGGHVIYFRHGATDPNQYDSDPRNLANCTTQRNLTDAGRVQAEAIGDAFRKLGIPVDTVLSSEYCRALEYSRLAFGTARPEQSLDLTDPLTDAQKTGSAQTVKRLLATMPTSGSNTILVSHSPNLRLAMGIDLTTEGEAAVFRVDATGGSTLVARVLPTDWPVLAEALAAR
jgi:phosphohistidine phosphatase SixA